MQHSIVQSKHLSMSNDQRVATDRKDEGTMSSDTVTQKLCNIIGNWSPDSRATWNSVLPGRDSVSLRSGYIIVM